MCNIIKSNEYNKTVKALFMYLKVPPFLLTFKMAAQDERECLVQQEEAAEEMLKGSEAETDSVKQKDSKLVLYHWTQSFSSQKVGEHDKSMINLEEVIALVQTRVINK